MSRSGYSDDYEEQWALIRWRGAVASAIRGKRGQAFLREMLAALDALEQKRLIKNDLVREGEVCAIGALGVARGVDMSEIDPEDRDTVAGRFGIPLSLASEVMYMNDEWHYREDPETRFARMRAWVVSEIRG